MTIVVGGSCLSFGPGFRGLFFGNKKMNKKEPEEFDDKMFLFTISIIGMVGCVLIALITDFLLK